MKLVGVTGGFCTGKTTVACFFKKLGAYVIDADKIVHSLYKEDKDIKKAILKSFGTKVFAKNGIDRRRLGLITFANKKRLKKLCNIIHPKVIAKIRKEILKAEKKSEKEPIVVIDAPLLLETGLHKTVDVVVVVEASFPAEICRAARKGFTKKDVLLRRSAQIPLRKKIKFADFVVDNNKSRKNTEKTVKKIWSELNRG